MADAIDLIRLYTRRCMLTGISYDLTFHHIIKDEHRGPRTIENGGLLFEGIHQWQHNYAEHHDKKLYIATNQVIRDYKSMFDMKSPAFEEWNRQNNLFYLEQVIEYYYSKHDIAMVKKTEREYERVLSKTYNNKGKEE